MWLLFFLGGSNKWIFDVSARKNGDELYNLKKFFVLPMIFDDI